MNSRNGQQVTVGLLITCLHFCVCQSISIRTFRYEKSSDGQSTRGGTSCVIAKNNEARGLRQGTGTNECAKLDESWFDEPMYEHGYMYLSQQVVEHHFDTSSFTIISEFPPNVIVGSTIDLYVKSSVNEDLHRFSIEILDSTRKQIYFHMNPRPNRKKVVFNDYVNRYWGYEEVKYTNPMRGYDTMFKIALRMGQYAIKILINDTMYYSFNHRHSMSLYGVVKYWSNWEHCQRIVYTAP